MDNLVSIPFENSPEGDTRVENTNNLFSKTILFLKNENDSFLSAV